MGFTVEQRKRSGLSGARKRLVVAALSVSPLVLLLVLRMQIRGGGLPIAAVVGAIGLLAVLVAGSVLRLRHHRRIVMGGLTGPVVVCQGTFASVWSFFQMGAAPSLQWLGQDLRRARSDVLVDTGQDPVVFEFVNAWGPPSHGRIVAPPQLAELVVRADGSTVWQVELISATGQRLVLEARGELDELETQQGAMGSS